MKERIKGLVEQFVSKHHDDPMEQVILRDDLEQLVKELEDVDEWKPYPDNKPETQGNYLISLDREDGFVQAADWDGKNFIESYDECDYVCEDVIAFRELPEPYHP